MKIVIKVLRWLAALVATVAALAIVPLVLVRAPSPLHSDRGLASLVSVVLGEGQMFNEAVVSIFVGMAWLAWFWLVVAFVVELVVAVTGAVPRELPGFGLGQAWVRPVIAALMWSSAASSMAMSVVGTGALSTLMSEAAAAQPFYDTGSEGSVSTSIRVAEEIELDDGITLVDGVQARRHVVDGVGVTMWDLAERHLGSPFRWNEIADLNLGVVRSGGLAIADPDKLEPGSVLFMPADAVDLVSPEPPRVQVDARADTSSRIRSIAVERGDSMWSLTEQVVADDLGRAPSEAEIAEVWAETVAENRDGIASGDPDLIYPGERIAVPASKSVPVLGEMIPAEAGSPGAKALAQRSDGSELAGSDGTLEAAETGGVVSGDPGLGDGDVVTVGPPAVDGPVTLPEVPEVPDVAPVPVAATRVDPAPTATSEPVQRADPASSESERVRFHVTPLAFGAFGAACLAVGIRGSITRRRDLQRRSRRPLTMSQPPTTAAAAFEVALAHAAANVVESRTGSGWRLMSADDVEELKRVGPAEFRFGPDSGLVAQSVGGRDKEQIDLGAPARHTDDANRPDDADAVTDFDPDSGAATDPGDPDDDEAGDRGTDATDTAAVEASQAPVIDLADNAKRVESCRPGVPVAPTSVLVGTAHDTGEAVYLDVASAGVVALRGEPEWVGAFARTAVVDLATSNRADDLSVVAVAADESMTGLDRVVTVSSFEAARHHVVEAGLAGSGTPVVVVAGEGPRDLACSSAVDSLVDLGVGIIAPDLQAETAIEFDSGTARITPDGSTVQVTSLGDDQFDALCELVEATGPSVCVPVDGDHVLAELDISEPSEYPVEPGPVEVKVLGPVVIDGAAPFSSLKAIGVIAYLAFHRHGVDADQIKSWVWPPFEPPTDKAFANVLSRARTGLGVDSNGEPLLSRAGADRTYRLSAEVTTDFERFCRLKGLADSAADSAAALRYLLHAVELIRGVPFTGSTPSNLAWADNHVRGHVEYTIDEAVHRCADLALELDDTEAARQAVRKGLELVPGCEECFRRRFLAAAQDENRDELRRAMADLERSSTADLGEPEGVDVISPELLALFAELDQRMVDRPRDQLPARAADFESELVVWKSDRAD